MIVHHSPRVFVRVGRCACAFGLLASLSPTAGRASIAQTAELVWELLGSGESELDATETEGISFGVGNTPPSLWDTLYAVNGQGVFRYKPDAIAWELLCEMSSCRGKQIVVTTEGYLVIGMTAGPSDGGERSTDGGFTWEHDVIGYGVTVLLQSTLPALGGAVYAGNANSVSWSLEGGAGGSWTLGEPMGGEPIALAEVLPSAALPDGRLLGGVWNGAVYSDDGGQTWTLSALQGTGSIAVNSLTFAPDSSHPYAGVAYAGVRDFSVGYPAVYRSDDGGVNWTLARAFPPGDFDVAEPDWVVVQAGPGKSLYASIEDIPGGSAPSAGPVVASFDGGTTWTQVADSTNGWGGFGVNVFRMGRDGRLYAATDRGVWRTVNPVPVANEPDPEVPDETGAALEVAPNPFLDEAMLILTLDQSAMVRLSVFDLLGREVAVLADRTYSAGTHELSTTSIRLPAGVSFVRAVVTSQGDRSRNSVVLTQQLTRVP